MQSYHSQSPTSVAHLEGCAGVAGPSLQLRQAQHALGVAGVHLRNMQCWACSKALLQRLCAGAIAADTY